MLPPQPPSLRTYPYHPVLAACRSRASSHARSQTLRTVRPTRTPHRNPHLHPHPAHNSRGLKQSARAALRGLEGGPTPAHQSPTSTHASHDAWLSDMHVPAHLVNSETKLEQLAQLERGWTPTP
eukprot:scaffold114626_cov48-Phaeocystis_antarctica.AAC.1